jgi:transketolase
MDSSMIQFVKKKRNQAKRKCLEICINAGKGHITSAFSCAEIVSVLYYSIMQYDIKRPHWQGRDRFIMSKNHGSIITYPILADLGFFNMSEIDTFLQNGSKFGMHSKKNIPGIDFSGGSLGIGLGVASGLAYFAKASHEDWLTFALLGDGECYEGSIWESAMFAGHNELYNLIAIIDRNNLSANNFTEKALRLEPFADKWHSFGWEVREVAGHDITALLEVFKDVRTRRGQPLCIIANTIKGKGIEYMHNQPFLHGKTPTGEKAKTAFEQLEADIKHED